MCANSLFLRIILPFFPLLQNYILCTRLYEFLNCYIARRHAGCGGTSGWRPSPSSRETWTRRSRQHNKSTQYEAMQLLYASYTFF